MKGHKHLSEDERRIAVNLIRTADENEEKMETYAKVADIIGVSSSEIQKVYYRYRDTRSYKAKPAKGRKCGYS